jgi:hypothetical protein
MNLLQKIISILESDGEITYSDLAWWCTKRWKVKVETATRRLREARDITNPHYSPSIQVIYKGNYIQKYVYQRPRRNHTSSYRSAARKRTTAKVTV